MNGASYVDEYVLLTSRLTRKNRNFSFGTITIMYVQVYSKSTVYFTQTIELLDIALVSCIYPNGSSSIELLAVYNSFNFFFTIVLYTYVQYIYKRMSATRVAKNVALFCRLQYSSKKKKVVFQLRTFGL